MIIIGTCLWLVLLSAITTRMNSMADGSIKTEPLPPVSAMQSFNLATAAAARSDYKAAVDGFQSTAELYLGLMERDWRVDHVKRVAECLMGRGHAHRSLGNLTESVRDYSRAKEFFEIIAQSGEALVTPRMRANCRIARGSAFAALHEYVFALDNFDQAIANILLEQNQGEQEHFSKGVMTALMLGLVFCRQYVRYG